jgi:hypothetical protein
VGADEHLQLPEPDPGVHRLLAGAGEISRILSQCDPVANGVDTSLLEHVSPIEWDNVVLYGQQILDPEARPSAHSGNETGADTSSGVKI